QRRVRRADAFLQQLELLGRLVQARGEAGRVEEAPEVVARVGEVRLRRGGHPPGVDPAEYDPQVRAEDVRYGATSGRAGKADTASYGRHRKRRLSSFFCVHPRVDPFLEEPADRKSTRLNSSHLGISYAVFCLKKK